MLAVREVSGRVLRPVEETHPREVVEGRIPKVPVSQGFAPHPIGVPGRGLHREHRVLEHRERGEDARNLKRSGETEPGPAVNGKARDRPTRDARSIRRWGG